MTHVLVYQTFIVMVFNRQKYMFVLIAYFLMSVKPEVLYMHVLAQLTPLANFCLDVNSFTSDLEWAIINSGKTSSPVFTTIGISFISSKQSGSR